MTVAFHVRFRKSYENISSISSRCTFFALALFFCRGSSGAVARLFFTTTAECDEGLRAKGGGRVGGTSANERGGWRGGGSNQEIQKGGRVLNLADVVWAPHSHRALEKGYRAPLGSSILISVGVWVWADARLPRLGRSTYPSRYLELCAPWRPARRLAFLRPRRL